jgi:AcrR family transcriptional regulator
MSTGRREQILSTAAELFARDGFNSVSIADLGAACDITGPAIYKHFNGKQAILATMLIGLSERLLTEAQRRVEYAPDDRAALTELATWHVELAIAHPHWIIVQERDWTSLQIEAREKVAGLQHQYVDLWVAALLSCRPELEAKPARAMVHAVFGLINSTPHNAVLPKDELSSILTTMALRALGD